MAKGFANGGVDAETVAGGEVARHVVGGDLVSVERHDIGAGRVPDAVRRVAAQQTADDDIGVGPMAILGDDGGHLKSRAGGCPGICLGGGQGQGCGETGELAAGEHAKSIAELDRSVGDV